MENRWIFYILIFCMATIAGIKRYDQDDFPDGEPALLPISQKNSIEDANELRSAMKGFGTEESKVMNILTQRTYGQRKSIEETYKFMFKRNLSADIKSELGGDLSKLLRNLLIDPLEYLAIELNDAMARFGTDEDTLTEILCTHTSPEIQRMAEIYKRKYKKELTTTLSSEISGNYNKLLQNIITVKRTNTGNTRNLSQTLSPNIKKKSWFGRSKSNGQQRFIDILSTATFKQIRLILQDFFEIGRQTLRDTITTETSGDFRKALLAIVSAAENRPRYYAKRLYDSMAKLGTNDKALIRIIVTRAELDMKSIKEEFKKDYKVTLESMISDETSGVYRKALLALIGGIQNPK